MFDTYVTRENTSYVTKKVDVHEHRAPTDESVKLLNEFTQKALSNITKSFATSNNTLQVTGAIYLDRINMDKIFMCKFTLNGKDNTFEIAIPEYVYPTQEKIVHEVYTRICNKLAEQLMQPFMQELWEKCL